MSQGADGKLLFHCHAGCSQEAVAAEFRARGFLTVNGRRSAPRATPESIGPSWELVSPVPPNAPPPPGSHPSVGRPTKLWKYADSAGATLFYVSRFDTAAGKEFRPLTLWKDTKGLRWRWLSVPTPRPLYGLDRLVVHPEAPVIVCEGEKSADAAQSVFPNHVCITSPNGGKSAGCADWTPLTGRKVTIWPDHDELGSKYANDVAAIIAKIGCAVSVIDVAALVTIDGGRRPSDREEKGWDAADALAEWGDLEQLRREALVLDRPHTAGAPAPSLSEAAIERRVAELSKLNELRYAIERAGAAKELGIPVTLLDKLVKGQRPHEGIGQGRPTTFPEVEPWPEPVDGAALVSGLVAALRCYVVLTDDQALAVILWAAFTHLHDCFDVSPRLVVKSALKRSGKTTLFRVLDRLVAKPRFLSGITSSALLRLIELHRPTMLIDETDALMAGNKEMAQALRGMMNAGFDRAGARLTMSVSTRDNGYEPREFSCWAPMALAGIGDLPSTVRDRSIEIVMKRKLKDDAVSKLRRRDGADLNDLARRLVRWSRDNAAALPAAEPTMPDGLNDRASDAWEPLLACAETVGGPWPERARKAALILSGDETAADDADADVMLLADISAAFEQTGVDRLSSQDLTNQLTALESRPWAEWGHGKPITKYQLSKRLKKYGVVSGTIKVDDGSTPKGYHRKAFEDAFSRYLPPTPLSTRHLATPPEKQGENELFELDTKQSGGEFKNAENSSNSRRGDEVASSKGYGGLTRVCAQCGGPTDGEEEKVAIGDETVWLHPECQPFYGKGGRL